MSSTKQARRYAHTPETTFLADAWRKAGPGTSSKIADLLGVSRARAAQLRHGTTPVPPDAAETIAGLLGVDPSRICAKYRIAREFHKRGKAIGSFSVEAKALARVAREYSRTGNGGQEFMYAVAAACGVAPQRALCWLNGKTEMPAKYAPKVAELCGLHPGQVCIEYLALHRFPTPHSAPETAAIPTGPMRDGEILSVRPDEPMLHIAEVDAATDRRRNPAGTRATSRIQALTTATARAMAVLQATDSEAAARLMAEIRAGLDEQTLQALVAEISGRTRPLAA